MGHPFALDFGAVMTMGAALGADAEMLADVMPARPAARGATPADQWGQTEPAPP